MALFRSPLLAAGVAAGPARRRLGPGRHGPRPVRDRAAGRRLARRCVRRGAEDRLVRVSGQRDAALRVGDAQRSAQVRPALRIHRRQRAEVGFDSVVGRPAAVEGRPADLGPRAAGDARDVRRRGGGGAWRWLSADAPAHEREVVGKSRAPARPAAEMARDGRAGARRGQLRVAGPAAGSGPLRSERGADGARSRRLGPVDAALGRRRGASQRRSRRRRASGGRHFRARVRRLGILARQRHCRGLRHFATSMPTRRR